MAANNPIKAVIFDLDGTITQPFFDFDAIRQEMGLDRNAGPVWELMSKMTPERRKQTEEILDFHERRGISESKLHPGAKDTLETLRSLGIKIGILTRNKRENALAVAKIHGLEFDSVIGREEGPVKPHPFGVLELCREFSVLPDETLMVGDYLFDLQSGKAAGASAVLLKNGHHNADFSNEADFTIENIAQILQIVENRK